MFFNLNTHVLKTVRGSDLDLKQANIAVKQVLIVHNLRKNLTFCIM